ncbi:hypothetical protein [Longimicrobium sp.]|uniref:hypothetical protein n=1 Tax=Longimicrobium sp. TaxID=2029185 RepID=UPI002BFEAB91|nr:hypothetical protein [Longimicrobium sp.]HSU12993.1 hypothetical protein [Longimicrobium sp.]
MPLPTRSIAAAFALLLGACTSYQPAAQPLPAPLPEHVRVVRGDNSSIRLFAPAISADSVVGRTPAGVRAAIPLADVRSVQTRRFDSSRTVLLAIAAGAAALIILSGFHRDVVYASAQLPH